MFRARRIASESAKILYPKKAMKKQCIKKLIEKFGMRSSFSIIKIKEAIYSACVFLVIITPLGNCADIFLPAGGNILKIDSNKNISVFASTAGYTPSGVAFDTQGNLYAKADNSILKIDANGNVSVFAQNSILGGSGALAFDSVGNLYAGNSDFKSVAKITSGGIVSLYATNASFSTAMTGLAFDKQNNLYVSTWENDKIIKITPGGVYSTFYQWSTTYTPSGIAIDKNDNLYVNSWENRLIGKIDQAGNYSVLASGSQIYGPYGMAIDSEGKIFSANYPFQAGNTITETLPDGTLTTYASGVGGTGGGLWYLAVPEPSALSLLAVGLGVVLRRCRRTV